MTQRRTRGIRWNQIYCDRRDRQPNSSLVTRISQSTEHCLTGRIMDDLDPHDSHQALPNHFPFSTWSDLHLCLSKPLLSRADNRHTYYYQSPQYKIIFSLISLVRQLRHNLGQLLTYPLEWHAVPPSLESCCQECQHDQPHEFSHRILDINGNRVDVRELPDLVQAPRDVNSCDVAS
jgi:hypothetical protein